MNVFGVGCYGIDMDLTLDGPTPWHAHGTASISFLFFSIGISVHFTWGESQSITLPPVEVMPILSGELGTEQWKAVLPNGSNLLVALRKLDPSESALVLHPVGFLQVSQRAIPLDLTLDKDGNQQPSDANYFTLDVTSGGLSKDRTLQEQFAPRSSPTWTMRRSSRSPPMFPWTAVSSSPRRNYVRFRHRDHPQRTL